MRIAIVGGGIAGLTTALSLHAAGYSPTVFEAVERPRPLGVGINLLPHAVRELTELDLLPELLSAGVEIDDLVYLMADGREVWREPRGLAAGYRWPQIAINRGTLYTILLTAVRERIGPDAVKFGHRLRTLSLGEDSVTLGFADRADASCGEVQASIVVGADGIHSAVRRFFYPDEGTPLWNGVTLWRSTTVLPAPIRGRSMIWAGQSRQKFVAYPIRIDPLTGETVLNWICDLKDGQGTVPPPGDWNRQTTASRFLPQFESWKWAGVNVRRIVEASSSIYEFPMVDRDPLPRWTFGRVTLVGDAAHPMYPIGSNGATQAIIDARVLAHHVSQAGTTQAGLLAYEHARRETTARIVMANRAQGPDLVLDLAAERAPTVKDNLDVRLPFGERARIADEYKKLAGFSPAALNARTSYSV